VHHCGIDATRPRGHTALTGAVDAQLAVKRDAADHIVVAVEWMKDGPEGAQVTSRLEPITVGTDVDGDEITSCYVSPVEGVPQSPTKPPRLPKAAQTALRALVEAIEECGEPAPASNHIPPGIRVTTLDRWRQYAYDRGISASPEPRARQQAFHRATEHLIGASIAVVWQNYVWRGRGGEQGGEHTNTL
jgi:hypothetical protein